MAELGPMRQLNQVRWALELVDLVGEPLIFLADEFNLLVHFGQLDEKTRQLVLHFEIRIEAKPKERKADT